MIMWTAACRFCPRCIQSVCVVMKRSATKFRMEIDGEPQSVWADGVIGRIPQSHYMLPVSM